MLEVRILQLESLEEIEREMSLIGAQEAGIEIMAPKSKVLIFKFTGLDYRGANILKQEMLSKGGDAVLPKDVYHMEGDLASALATGTVKQFKDVLPKLARQPFKLKEVAGKLSAALEAYLSDPPRLEVAGKTLDLAARTYLMGILNITPDSFSDGGEHFKTTKAIECAKRMVEAGADIIDVGGESTRPGAKSVSAEEEMNRVLPVISAVAGSCDAILSIDTSKPGVALAVIEAGAHMVNDVTGLADSKMIEVVAAKGVPAIVMHMKGTPRTMQLNPEYDDLMGEIIEFLRTRIEAAEAAGVASDKLLIDPGIGFGKTFEHNLAIIKRLPELKVLRRGIVLGTSRKAFIGKILDIEVASERVFGTAATVAIAISKGANIVRVHDVEEMAQVAKMTDAILSH